MVVLSQDKPLLLQQTQRFSQRGTAHPELVRKLKLRERGPWRKRPIKNPLPQICMHVSNNNPSFNRSKGLKLHTRGHLTDMCIHSLNGL